MSEDFSDEGMTRGSDRLEKVKVNSSEVRLGMFVCELDRPWLMTPFPLQGFEIRTVQDISRVQEYCRYVYIDVRRTGSKPALSGMPQTPTIAIGEAIAPREEFKVADVVTARTGKLIQGYVENIHQGTAIDIQMAREAVAACVGTVLRNPQAILCIAQMREKSDALSQHAMSTCVYSIIVGRALGLAGKDLETLGTAALLHDMGKVSVPEEVLGKAGPLGLEEYALVKQHAKFGRETLLGGLKTDDRVAEVAYSHHERLDGSGYPRGLRGSELDIACRIVAAAEKYEALTSIRPHRPAYTHLDAMNVVNRMVKRGHVDEMVVNHFFTYLGTYPPGTVVELSDGEKAIVLETNPNQRLRPIILVVRDRENNPVTRFVDMALRKTDESGKPYRVRHVLTPAAAGINLLDYRELVIQTLA